MGEPQLTKSTCPYCGVGCGVLIEARDEQIISVVGDPEHPANRGKLCSKGASLAETVGLHDRLLQPQFRVVRSAAVLPRTWSETEAFVAEQLAKIINEHGPDAVAFYGSGQLLTEDYYALNKLARAVVSTNNIDTNSRLCMSSAVAGYKATLGADVVPCDYADIDSADLFFITGSNTAWAHPIAYRRIEAARANKPSRTIVVDPRRTVTAAEADLHLAIKPGTDVALLHGILHQLIWQDALDLPFIARHTEDFAALKQTVQAMPVALAASICGVPAEQIVQAAAWWAESPNVLSLYCQGLNQSTSGTAKNAALIGLHLATGQIGRAGCGPFSLTGQPNAMGGREVGALANLLPGHRDAANATHRAEVAAYWGVPGLPEREGKTAVACFQAIERGEIKAVWIACTNPAQSLPDSEQVRRALAKAELVIVQEAFASSETLAFADVILPAATWGEKTGTVTNSERCLTRVGRAIPPPGESKQDWQIFTNVGRALAVKLNKPAELMAFDNSNALWQEFKGLTEGRSCDMTRIPEALLQTTPTQWPYQQRPFSDHQFAHANGRAKFVNTPFTAPAEAVNAERPFALTTSRLRDHWHGMTRTSRAAKLFQQAPLPEISMNPSDASRRRIADNSLVSVRSARGQIVVFAKYSEAVRSGCADLPMHWGSRYLSGGINKLTQPAFDPSSKQPELKFSAVQIVPFVASHWLTLSLLVSPAQRDSKQQALMQCLTACEFVTASPSPADSGSSSAINLQAAQAQAFSPEQLQALDALLADGSEHSLRYDDSRQTSSRRIEVSAGLLRGFRVFSTSPATPLVAWLNSLLLAQTDISGLTAQLLSPKPPTVLTQPRSPTVCTCLNVSQAAISACLQSRPIDQAALPYLQAQLACGTQCGSCIPELKALIALK